MWRKVVDPHTAAQCCCCTKDLPYSGRGVAYNDGEGNWVCEPCAKAGKITLTPAQLLAERQAHEHTS